jgi:hypothetical protein
MTTNFQITHRIEWSPIIRNQTSYISPQYVDVMRIDQEINGYYFAYTQEEWKYHESLSSPTWKYNIQQGSFFHRDYSEIALGRVIEY